LDSPRIALIRRLFELMETEDLSRVAEELLANSTEDVVFEPHASHGKEIRGHEALRQFWSDFESEGLEMRAGVYSMVEEGDAVVVDGWVRTIDQGRLADTQSRWIYRFNDQDQVVSARVERA
jgi:ketosteroid isomerase-like protein